MRMKTILSAMLALIAAPAIVLGANIALQTGPVDTANLRGILNSLIQSINSGVTGNITMDGTASATGTGTSEQILKTYTLPAGTLAVNGQALRIRCYGVTGATANNKTMKLYFGASVITTPTAATNAKGFYLEMTVMRTGAATQQVNATGYVDTTPVTPYANAGTDDLTADAVIKCTGTDGTSAAADITVSAFQIEALR
jgi:hypothetical protein